MDSIPLYLDLLERCLTRLLFPDQVLSLDCHTIEPYRAELRLDGRDWPTEAETMIGMQRLKQLELACRQALAEGIPGDFVETGVWKGGASILMRAVLKAYGDPFRRVWVADSFAGLPAPDGRYPQDEGDPHHTFRHLAISESEVRRNFERYRLLDERVRFLPGWFHETLPCAPIEKIAVLRLDGDMYGSTWDALTALYPRVSPKGFIIIDDYGAIERCRQAVEDFRAQHSISAPLTRIDWTGAWWRKD